MDLKSVALLARLFDPMWDLDCVEASLVSLIDQGLIKGYLLHTRQIVIFAAKINPFPSPYLITKKIRG